MVESSLQKFHESCKSEFVYLMKKFNILLYGYGNKERILSNMFSEAKIYNLRFASLKSIVDDLVLEGFCNKRANSITDIDMHLSKTNKKIILILLNFDFSLIDLQSLKFIKIIGTIENINTDFTQEDLVRFNFILRDFTTFEDYTDDIVELNLTDNKLQNVLTVLSNLSKKSKLIFKELIAIGNCSAGDLYEKVKSILFLTKLSSCIDLLKEFIDHKIIRINEDKITINLNIKERNILIEKFTNGDVVID